MTLRKRFPTRVHHVMGRGVNGGLVYGDDSDKELFMELVAKAAGWVPIRIHAYALMSNHYHMMLTGEGLEVSRFMYHLLCPYAQAYNRRWNRYGPLFQGRFHSVPIFNPMRALETSCYVHQNPVPPGLAARAQDYRWSSIGYYIGTPSVPPPWIDTGLVEDILHRIRPGVSIEYERLMDLYVGDEADSWVEGLVKEAQERFKANAKVS